MTFAVKTKGTRTMITRLLFASSLILAVSACADPAERAAAEQEDVKEAAAEVIDEQAEMDEAHADLAEERAEAASDPDKAEALMEHS